MPYSNLPESKWPAMERCVEKVMKEHEGEEGFSKENAVKICYTSVSGSEAEFEIVQDPTEINVALGATYMPGELLRFRNAELAKVEVNANRDEVDSQNVDDLVATLPLMPIDDEHKTDRVIGVFTAAKRSDDDRLLTDGLVYARRFPDVADAIMNGRKKLSLEAYADYAICSVCGGEFKGAAGYCDHLRNRRVSGAVRRFVGLRAVGGGAVRNPADKTAGFDQNHVYLVASHSEDDEGSAGEDQPEVVESGESVTETEGGVMTVEEIQEQLNQALAALKEAESERDKEKEEKEEDKEKLDSAMAEMDALKASLEAVREQNAKLAESHRRQLLAKVLTDEEFDGRKDVIMGMSEEAVELLASKAATASSGGQLNVNLDPPSDGKKVVTL